MALNIARSLCTRSILTKSQSLVKFSPLSNQLRCVTIKVVPKQAEPVESYDERNARFKRELSPHLLIYKPQLTTMLSITHRMTGCLLATYVSMFGLSALLLPHDFSHYITMIEGLQMSAPTLFVAKYVLAFPFAYHTCNGVRHLFWDLGRFLKIREVYSTGYAMLGSSVALTILLSLL